MDRDTERTESITVSEERGPDTLWAEQIDIQYWYVKKCRQCPPRRFDSQSEAQKAWSLEDGAERAIGAVASVPYLGAKITAESIEGLIEVANNACDVRGKDRPDSWSFDKSE